MNLIELSFSSAVREDRAPGGRPRIKSLIGLKENADTFMSSELIIQLIQARPDSVPKRRYKKTLKKQSISTYIGYRFSPDLMN